MNCKQGDLAIVVVSESGLNLGKIVRCVRWVGKCDRNPATGHKWIGPQYLDAWEIDPPLITDEWALGVLTDETYPLPLFPDSCLRPLRGDLLDEETEREAEIMR